MHGIGTWPQWEGTNESRYAQLVRGTRVDGAVDAVCGIPNGTTWYTVIRSPPLERRGRVRHTGGTYTLCSPMRPPRSFIPPFYSNFYEETQSFLVP